MQIHLDNRLLSVAKLVLPGKAVADIGTDHNCLPVYLVMNGISPKVIASDKARGPFNNACQLVELLSLDKQIDMRFGDGLQILRPGEVTTICISGMGGHLIANIIEDALDVAVTTKRLVLQPQNNVSSLRRFLICNGWRIVAEDIATDRGFYYQIIAAERGAMKLNDQQAEFGPCLLAAPHPLLGEYMQLKLSDLEALIEQISDKPGENVQERLRALRFKADQIKDLLYKYGREDYAN